MKKTLLSILFFSLITIVSYAQVVCNNNGVAFEGPFNVTTSTLSNYTVPTGNKSALVVGIIVTTNRNTLNVAFNGTALTKLGDYSNTYELSFWYLPLGDLVAPQTGDIVVNFSSGAGLTGHHIFASSFHNVDQTTPMDGFVSNDFGSSGTSSSLTLNGSIGDKAIDLITARAVSTGAPVLTPTSGQTIESSISPGIVVSGGSFQSASSVSATLFSGTSINQSWTIANNNNVFTDFHVAATIKSAGLLPPPPPPPPTPLSPIPTMSEWGLLIFGLLVLNMGVFFIRRKQLA